jgi:hypothetical protein
MRKFGLVFSALVISCASEEADDAPPETAAPESVIALNGNLYILNQGGHSELAMWQQLISGDSNFNQLAGGYPRHVWLGSVSEYMVGNDCGWQDWACVVRDIRAHGGNPTGSDVVLQIDATNNYGQTGGQNCSDCYSTLNVASIGGASGSESGQTIYATHEVFEVITNNTSGDCPDGETTDGNLDWCSECGPQLSGRGACGRFYRAYSSNDVLPMGIADFYVASTNSWKKVQEMSPYASLAATGTYDGTAVQLLPSSPLFSGNAQAWCDKYKYYSTAPNGSQLPTCLEGQDGFGNFKAALFSCDASNKVVYTAAPFGCTGSNYHDNVADKAYVADTTAYSVPYKWFSCEGDGNIHATNASGTRIYLKCAAGCNVNPVGTHDTCK